MSIVAAAASLIVPCHSTRRMNNWSCYRFPTIISNHARLPAITKHGVKFDFPRNQPLRSFNVKDVVVYSGAQPELPLPSDPSPHSWKVWIIGMLISVILPFWRNKWGPLQILKNKVEAVMETAENVAEIVEDVAEKVEKVADEVGDHLPQSGKLKDAVTFIENAAKETARDAHLADEFIEKVEEVEKAVESFIDPDIDQANKEATKQ